MESANSETQDSQELDRLIIDSQLHGTSQSSHILSNGGTVSNIPPTTTISTIAVQAGSSRIVIALLQSKEWLQLKILELEPDLSKIGTTLEEAMEYQKQHEDVLMKLQGKQSPVEELLNQADQLISTQKPRAEVYAAMAESLGLAWRDLNNQLERRKQLLEQSVAFHIKAREFTNRLDKGESDCRENILSTDVDVVRRYLQQHHDIKKGVLEASMLTLNEGQSLLEKLRQLATEGTLDSRPNHLTISTNSVIYQVEHFMETLHDRRRRFEDIWLKRKILLEQCLQLCLLYNDITQLTNWLQTKGKEYTSFSNLGDSSPSAEILQHDHGKIEIEAKQMQDRGIRFLRTAEQLNASGHYAGVEAERKAYELLDLLSEFTNKVDLRRRLLTMAVSFFRCAHSAITKLDQLEIQLTTSDPSRSLSTQITQTINEVVDNAVKEGHHLLSETNKNDIGVQGVVKTVAELEERRKKLITLCSNQKIETEVSTAVKLFLATCRNLHLWLTSNGESFLHGHQDMGSVLAMAKEFLQRHEQLLKDVLNKGPEVEAVFRSFPNLLKLYPDSAAELEDEIEKLRTVWMVVNTSLESRVQLSRLYTNFHRLAVQLANEMDSVEAVIVAIKDGIQPGNEATASIIEEKWLALQQVYLQMKNTGKNFKFDAKKCKDSHLDLQRAILCVDTLLEHFQNRQTQLTSLRENWQSNVSQHKEMKTQYEKYIIEIQKTMEWITNIQIELYPVISGDVMNVQSIIWELERKLDSFLPTIKEAQSELEAQLRSSESLKVESDGETDKIVSELANLSQGLNTRITEYQILLSILIAYFKKVFDIEKMVEKLEMQFSTTMLPSTTNEVENLLKEHEAGKQAILELFRFSENERTPLIKKIHEQEPPIAALKDEEKLIRSLELIQKHWEKAWHEHKQHLERHLQLCQFNYDLKQINNQLKDLSTQLANIRGNYGESLPAARATSQAFIQFEKTIELLEKRITTFVSTAEKLMIDQQAERQHIKFEIDNLHTKWMTFHMQVGENRKLIDLAIEYFKLVEESEDWFKEGSKLLIQIARKSTSCHTPAEANNLLNEVHMFLKPGEAEQEERLRKILLLATQIYGNFLPVKVDAVSVKNKEMLDSFAVIHNDLSTLALNLKIAEKEKESKQAVPKEETKLLEAQKVKAEAAEIKKTTESLIKLQSIKTTETIDKQSFKVSEAVPFVSKPDPSKSSSMPTSDEKVHHIAPVFIVPLHAATVIEGNRWKFMCRVTGYPTPDIQWYKDGIPIINNPDYQTIYEPSTGLCSLTIEETFSEDTATFSCKAGNAAGIVETQGKLTVKEAGLTEDVSPVLPVFVREFNSKTLKVDDTLQLECEVTAEPLPIVSWFKNEVCIDTSPGYTITYNNGVSLLRIDKMTLNDTGKFKCQATNKAGQVSCSASVCVESNLPLIEPPKFVQPLSNVMARAGQKLRLECCISGVPEPHLTWLHNNKPISRDVKITVDGQRASLSIPEAFPKDAGSYVVVAKNEGGEVASSCTVSVKGRLPLETSDSEFASDMEPVKPRIIQELKNLTVKESQKVRLDCMIIGQPEPEVIWYRDSVPIKESPDVQLLFEGDMCSLIIKEALLEDSGDYKVIAINAAGETSSQCSVTVKPAVGETEIQNRRNVMIISTEKAIAPKFSQLLTDISVVEGESVILSCCVTGDPEPFIIWFKDDNEITSTNICQIVGGKSGFQTLKIPRVLPEDSGTYTVKACNIAGDAKCFCSLKVHGPAVPWEKLHKLEVIESPPLFIKTFGDQTVFAGLPVTFDCLISGHPNPKIIWLFNEQPIQGNNFIISSDGQRNSLVIPSVDLNNSGKITCIAENEIGKATCVGSLHVTDTISEPVDANKILDQYSQPSIQTSSFTKSTMVQQSFSSRTTRVTSGENVEVHKITSQEDHKLQKIGNQPLEESHESKKEEERRTEPLGDLIIKQSTKAFGDSGKTMLENVSTQYPALESTLHKSLPPKFIKPLLSLVPQVGDKVQFIGQVEGYPEPSIKWYKNGSELIKPEFPTSFNDGTATLLIPSCTEKDSGKYTCTARNISGTASSSADLQVKSTRIIGPLLPPQFVKNLHAQVVKCGEKVEMLVEVTGMPKPEITWTRNGQPIYNSSRHILSSINNVSTLTLNNAQPEDSGKYMVKAVNSAGEAYSIVDFVVNKEPSATQVCTRERVSYIEEKKQKVSKVSTSIPEMIHLPKKSNEIEIVNLEQKFQKTDSSSEMPEYVASSRVWTPIKVPKAEFAVVEQSLQVKEEINEPTKPVYVLQKIDVLRSDSPKLPPSVPPKPKQLFSESEDEFVRKELSFNVNFNEASKEKVQTFSPLTSNTVSPLSKVSIYSPPPTSITPSRFIPIASPPIVSADEEDPMQPAIWKPGGEQILPSWKPVKPPANVAKPKPKISENVQQPIPPSEFETPPSSSTLYEKIIHLQESSKKEKFSVNEKPSTTVKRVGPPFGKLCIHQPSAFKEPVHMLPEPGPPPEFGYVDPKSVSRPHRSVVPPQPPTPTSVPKGGVPVYPGVGSPCGTPTKIITSSPSFPKISKETSYKSKIITDNEKITRSEEILTKSKFVSSSGLSQPLSPPVRDQPLSLTSTNPPCFVKLLDDKVVDLGEVAVFDCIVQGDPTPDIKWYRNDRPLSPNPQTQTIQPCNLCRLTIPGTDVEDTCVITCIARNPSGSATTSAKLKVEAKCKDSSMSVSDRSRKFEVKSSQTSSYMTTSKSYSYSYKSSKN